MANIEKWTRPTASDIASMQRRLYAAIVEISQACQRRIATDRRRDHEEMDPIVSITVDHSGRGKLSIARYFADHAEHLDMSFDTPRDLARHVLGMAEFPELPDVDPQAN
jgi:hypothetical protein